MNLGQGAKALLLTGAAVVVFAGLKLAAAIVLPLLLAAFVAALSAPLVAWLRARGVPRGAATITALLADVSVLGVLGLLVLYATGGFLNRLPKYRRQVLDAFDDVTKWLAEQGVDVGESVERLGDPSALVGHVALLLNNLIDVLSSLVLVLVLVALMLLEAGGLDRKLLRTVRDSHTVERVHAAAHEINKYLVVKTGTSLATGLLIGGWTAVMGVDLPLLWGLLAFLLNYVPAIGSLIAAVPAVALTALDAGLGTALVVAGGYGAVNIAIGNVIEPRVMGRALGLSPLVVFVALMFWGWLLGPVGAVLSAPLTVVVKVALANTDDLAWLAVLLGPPDAQVAPGVPAAAGGERREVEASTEPDAEAPPSRAGPGGGEGQ